MLFSWVLFRAGESDRGRAITSAPCSALRQTPAPPLCWRPTSTRRSMLVVLAALCRAGLPTPCRPTSGRCSRRPGRGRPAPAAVRVLADGDVLPGVQPVPVLPVLSPMPNRPHRLKRIDPGQLASWRPDRRRADHARPASNWPAHERVQFTDVFRYRPTANNLRQYEHTLEEKSWFQQNLRPEVQHWFLFIPCVIPAPRAFWASIAGSSTGRTCATSSNPTAAKPPQAIPSGSNHSSHQTQRESVDRAILQFPRPTQATRHRAGGVARPGQAQHLSRPGHAARSGQAQTVPIAHARTAQRTAAAGCSHGGSVCRFRRGPVRARHGGEPTAPSTSRKTHIGRRGARNLPPRPSPLNCAAEPGARSRPRNSSTQSAPGRTARATCST